MFRFALARSGRMAARRVQLAAPANVSLAVAARNIATQTRAKARNGPGLLAVGAGAAALASGFGYMQMVEAKDETGDYGKVRETIADLLSETPDMGPTLVRLAWHSSGTWDAASKTGGSNGGTMRYAPESTDGANAGLHLARDFLEPVKKQFPWITYGDLWTLSAVVAIEEMGGPAIGWRAGRVDKEAENCPPNGRLPDADKGSNEATIQHVRDVFYRMGFNDREIVALIGAHALGRCHVEASGYTGPWTRAPTTFSNEYYKELLETKWTIKKWKGPEQYEDPSGELMMLPADMALVWDPKFKAVVELYAKDEAAFFKDFASAFQRLEEFGLN